jgi:hypothetical protein
MSDKFSMYDAAYLLGSLTPQDRADFEAHLSECRDCSRSVNQLAGMPGLLANVPPEHTKSVGAEGPPVPDTLLPRLLAEVQRTRFRRRWTTGLIGVAAAAIIAIAAVVGLSDSSGSSPLAGSHPSVAQKMTPVSKQIPIHATARLADKAWGTQVTILCTYEGSGSEPGGGFTYTMVVTDKAGASQQIAAWEAKPGQPALVSGATSVPKSQIASVEVLGPSAQPILTLKL